MCYNLYNENNDKEDNMVTLFKNKLNIILKYFILMGPIVDIITSYTLKYNFALSFGSIIRFMFLLLLLLIFIFEPKNDDKNKILRYIILLTSYIFIYMIMMLNIKEQRFIGYELNNLVRTFYLPYLLLVMYYFNKKKLITFDTMIFVKTYYIYLLLILIPNILGLSFLSYAHSKVGNVGWFFSANEISAILSILMPFFIDFLIKYKNKLLMVISFLMFLVVLFGVGTKGPILTLIIIIMYYIINLIKKLITKKQFKKIGILCIVALLFISIGLLNIKKTSFYKNIKIHLDFLNINNPVEIITDFDKIDHFIFSQRLTFLSNVNNIYIKSPLTEKVFGVGYTVYDKEGSVNLKMIEMDYFDIFYRHGVIGFIIYFIPYGYLLIRTRKNREKVTLMGIIISILLSLITGHVLVAPAVSIYVVIFLSIFNNNEKVLINDKKGKIYES